jgi:two-component system sporulation sensor kinase C
MNSHKVQSHFKVVADATYDWESWHDVQGQLMWVNPAVERITGYSVEHCLEMPRYPIPMIHESDLARVVELFRGFQSQSSGNDIEFRIQHRSGHIVYVSISWQPMYDAKGVHLGCRTSIRDVSERQELRKQITRYNERLEQLVQEKTERLQQLERKRSQLEKLAALGQLAAGVAHEINNPLAGIRNAFQLIRADLSPSASSYALIDLVDKEIERMAALIRSMFNTFRQQPEIPKSLELGQIIQQVIQMLRSTAEGRGVSLIASDISSDIRATLPEGQLKQILYNLGRNAIQACCRGQWVRFSAEDAGASRIILRVNDNGSGIDAEALSLIFEPYFSTKSDIAEPSMGLGLSICKGLVDSIGGEISVQSLVGEGTEFVVSLPKTPSPVESSSSKVSAYFSDFIEDPGGDPLLRMSSLQAGLSASDLPEIPSSEGELGH